jgi:hypothetical protein
MFKVQKKYPFYLPSLKFAPPRFQSFQPFQTLERFAPFKGLMPVQGLVTKVQSVQALRSV